MTERKKIAVLGGDERQIYMARALAQKGYEVTVWGLGAAHAALHPAVSVDSWESAVASADAVILPLPASADGVRIHCPLHHREEFLRVTSLLDAIRGKILLGGRMTPPMFSIAEQKQIRCLDYFESEALQLRNALPTAEGAIAIALKELPVTLDGCVAAVVGYGRIGVLLAEKLQAMGASVHVYARRRESLVVASLHHQTPHQLQGMGERSSLAALPPDCRVVFNTVPSVLFDRAVLSHVPPHCLLIDLASAPGGIDRLAAQEMGVRNVWGTALPGKCAPESAGILLAETLVEMLQDE